MSLTTACITGDPNLVKIAIKAGHPFDQNTFDAALGTRNFQILELICASGAPTSSRSLTLACQTQNEQMVNYALAAGARLDNDTLATAIKTGNSSIIDKIQKVASLSMPQGISACTAASYGSPSPFYGASTLKAAIESGREDIISGILQQRPQEMNQVIGQIDWSKRLHLLEKYLTPGIFFPSVYPFRYQTVQAISNLPTNSRLRSLAISSKLVTATDLAAFDAPKILSEQAAAFKKQAEKLHDEYCQTPSTSFGIFSNSKSQKLEKQSEAASANASKKYEEVRKAQVLVGTAMIEKMNSQSYLC